MLVCAFKPHAPPAQRSEKERKGAPKHEKELPSTKKHEKFTKRSSQARKSASLRCPPPLVMIGLHHQLHAGLLRSNACRVRPQDKIHALIWRLGHCPPSQLLLPNGRLLLHLLQTPPGSCGAGGLLSNVFHVVNVLARRKSLLPSTTHDVFSSFECLCLAGAKHTRAASANKALGVRCKVSRAHDERIARLNPDQERMGAVLQVLDSCKTENELLMFGAG